MFTQKNRRSYWNAARCCIVGALCVSITLAGCRDEERTVLPGPPDEAELQIAGDEAWNKRKEELKKLNEKYPINPNTVIEKAPDGTPTVQVTGDGKVSGLAQAKLRQIDSYEHFKKLFKEKTGKDWDSVQTSFVEWHQIYRGIEGITLPDIGPLQAALEEEAGNTRDKAGQTKFAKFRELVQTFNDGAKTLHEQVQQLKQVTAPAFDQVDVIVQRVEGLKALQASSAEAGDNIKQLLDIEVPKLLAAIEGLQQSGFEERVKLAHDSRKSLMKTWKQLSGLLGGLKGLVSEDTLQTAQEYVDRGQDFIEKVNDAAASMAFAAVAAESLMTLFAINPYVAAAVAVIMLIASLFSDGGGNGGDGGDGPAGPAKQRNGVKDAPPNDGTKPKGDPEVKPNPGLPPSAKVEPIGGDDSKIGSTFDPAKANVWFDSAWEGNDKLHILVLFDKAGNSSRRLVLEPSSADPKVDDLLQALREGRDGKRNVNIPGITATGNDFPITVSITGLTDGGQAVEIRWKAPNEFEVVKGL